MLDPSLVVSFKSVLFARRARLRSRSSQSRRLSSQFRIAGFLARDWLALQYSGLLRAAGQSKWQDPASASFQAQIKLHLSTRRSDPCNSRSTF